MLSQKYFYRFLFGIPFDGTYRNLGYVLKYDH